jgi:hypothetical protein
MVCHEGHGLRDNCSFLNSNTIAMASNIVSDGAFQF